ncbi:MAG: helix-turn-helix domain-containing protein [Proteobacteria bacterium]|jgi:excisionase family DNA binding protein|nr:helix-turn-helix domain-containing protein [Pseudomonadota bacterium]NLN63775.1 helix-turn-helix domain-containing protein [Myxococcales bacterium]
MSETKSENVYSVKEVATMCHVSNETIRRWIRSQGLNAYNNISGLAIKIVESDLREFSESLKIYVDWNAVKK